VPFILFLFVGSMVCVVVAWTTPNGFLTGVVVGACLVALPGTLWVITMQATGTAQTMIWAIRVSTGRPANFAGSPDVDGDW
jgi:hypothetical protein